jgi:hypothetical protein
MARLGSEKFVSIAVEEQQRSTAQGSGDFTTSRLC